jgi:hypothetical protein
MNKNDWAQSSSERLETGFFDLLKDVTIVCKHERSKESAFSHRETRHDLLRKNQRQRAGFRSFENANGKT